MKIAYITFECLPFIKVGGLADVSLALATFIRKNHDIRIILPLHTAIDREKYKIKQMYTNFNTPKKIQIKISEKMHIGELYKTEYDSLVFYFIDNRDFFNRERIYADEFGEYPDNPIRYIFFCRAALEALKSIPFKPDIIHCCDMQTGLIPAYLKTIHENDSFFSECATVFSIHNIAYQGIYEAEYLEKAQIPWSEFTYEKLEFYGKINLMKAGIVYSDIITTVSPTYAQEIQNDPECSCGLNGLLSCRSQDIIGILNGLDYKIWNPGKDNLISQNYTFKVIEKKKKCKQDLMKILNFKSNDAPLFGMVSRLDQLKGFHLLIESLDELMKHNLKLVILGMGDKYLQDTLKQSEERYPEKMRVRIEFNDELAHKIYAGCDFFLMPSKYEPCGLGQMISLKYGTIPIVHKTGGLADTVRDVIEPQGNGIVFTNYEKDGLIGAIKRATEIYNDKRRFKKVIKNAMKSNFSFKKCAEKYLEVYKKAIEKKS